METEVSIARVVLSLAMVLGLLGLLAWVLKWFADKSIIMRQMGNDKRLKLVESMVLDPKHKCFIIACDSKEYVVVSSGNNVEVLASQDQISQEPKEAKSA